jgi:hypothetical protein
VQLLRTLTRWVPDDDIASGVARTMVRLTEPPAGAAPLPDDTASAAPRGSAGRAGAARVTTPAGSRVAPARGKRRGPPAA